MADAVEMRGIGKAFFGVPVLEDVDLVLRAGEVHGLIGENGAGKSTLMNILGGVVKPDEGSMATSGAEYAPAKPGDAAARGIAFIHQELNLFQNLSIADNLCLHALPLGWHGMVRGDALRARARDLLKLVALDLPPAWPVGRLSPGERQLVEIAAALGRDASVLIFDEPTTSLTARETARLFGLIERLRAENKAIIYISHELRDVQRLCDRITILRDGRVAGGGPIGAFDVPAMIRAMVGRQLTQIFPPSGAPPEQQPILDLQGVCRRGVVENVSLTVRVGETVGLFGLLGAGRTELARILFGLDGLDGGEIRVAGEVLRDHTPRARVRDGVAFVTENRRAEGLMIDRHALDNIALAALPRFARRAVVARKRLRSAVEDITRTIRLKVAGVERQAVRSLSGGNQQKVVLGKWLMTKPRLFVLDEPTRGVDVGAKREIYALVRQLTTARAGLLVISSEIEELIGLCDRIYVMANGEIVAEFAGPQFPREAMMAAAFRITAEAA